eukprot:719706-Amphidinium_carterae.1
MASLYFIRLVSGFDMHYILDDSVSPQEDGDGPMGSTVHGAAGLGRKDIFCQRERNMTHTH